MHNKPRNKKNQQPNRDDHDNFALAWYHFRKILERAEKDTRPEFLKTKAELQKKTIHDVRNPGKRTGNTRRGK